MAKPARRGFSSQGGPLHGRQGAGLQDSEQLNDGAEEGRGLRRKKRAVLIISDDEAVDEEGISDGEIDYVSTHGRPGDMPSHIPLGAPLEARHTAQDIAPGFMKVVAAGVEDLSFVRWYCDIAEGVGCSQKCFSDADPLQCTQCAQKNIKCRYPISENPSHHELRCIPCGKGRSMDCSWSQDLKRAYLREAYQLDVGEARVLVSSTDDDPQATLAAYYQAWRTDPATHALDDDVRLSLRKVQGCMRPERVTRSKLIATNPTPLPPLSTPASTIPKFKGPSHNGPATPHRLAASAGPVSSHTRRNTSDDAAKSDPLTSPPSTVSPLRFQIHDGPSTEAISGKHTVSLQNARGRLPDSAHDAQVNSTHIDASPAVGMLGTVVPHLPDLPGEAVQGLDQFLKSLLGSNSSTTKPLQERIHTLEAELQQVKSELEAEKVLRHAHTLDAEKIIADQEKTIADRDKIIADQQRTIVELSRNTAKMNICSQVARHLISSQPNVPSGMLAADITACAAPPTDGQCQVTTSDVRDLMHTLLPTILSHADHAGRQWVEQVSSLVQGTSSPTTGKRPVGEISGSPGGSGQKSQAKRKKQIS
ncbi:hypothetical protein BDR04DRAFT_1164434 [Suillus decipiens]|nr:hypothetical protein BDR04DRAFT_1164434 [Suillus decipiens]